jgi:hypothetical protein
MIKPRMIKRIPPMMNDTELRESARSKPTRRFLQQISFLREALQGHHERARLAQAGINEQRLALTALRQKITDIKGQFERYFGVSYYSERSEVDPRKRHLAAFDERFGPALTELLGKEKVLDAGIKTAESERSLSNTWVVPTGILLQSISGFFGVDDVRSILPGVISGASRGSPEIGAGDRRRKKLDEIQEAIAGVALEQQTLEVASVPQDEFKRRAINALAGSMLETNVKGFYPHQPEYVDFSRPLSMRDLAALLGVEHVANRLCEISAPYQKAYPPIGREERSKRLGMLETKLLSLEMEEEREVLALFDSNVFVTRREAARPAVLINVWMTEQFERSSPQNA